MFSVWRTLFLFFFILGFITLDTGFGISSDDHRDKIDGYGLGHVATLEEVREWNIDISPQGDGLPPGQGSVKEGAQIFSRRCASCHGATGSEGSVSKLVGGQGSLNNDHPVKTVGSYWPYATTLFDYIFRAMPPTAPQSLTPNEVYAVVAWILYQNEIVPKTAIMDANTLPAVQMPNRHGFVPDPRPDVPKKENP